MKRENKHMMKSNQGKVGFTCRCFDLFHAGHVAMLREATTVCDYLIVALQTDPTLDRPEKNQPVQTVVERYMQIQACKYVDEIIVYATEQDLMDLLNILPVDIRILGEEYRGKDFTGHKLEHIATHFNKRDHRFSTSDLRKRVKQTENK